MSRLPLLERVDESIIASDEELYNNELPINANTLEGYPVEYFASKTEVYEALSTYLSNVLGTSY